MCAIEENENTVVQKMWRKKSSCDCIEIELTTFHEWLKSKNTLRAHTITKKKNNNRHIYRLILWIIIDVSRRYGFEIDFGEIQSNFHLKTDPTIPFGKWFAVGKWMEFWGWSLCLSTKFSSTMNQKKRQRQKKMGVRWYAHLVVVFFFPTVVASKWSFTSFVSAVWEKELLASILRNCRPCISISTERASTVSSLQL